MRYYSPPVARDVWSMSRWWWLLGGVLIAVGMGWWVVQVTHLAAPDRANASGYGQFVLAAIGLLMPVAGRVIEAFTTTNTRVDTDRLTDDLALMMRNQWTRAATERRLLEPAPLPIRWHRAKAPLAGPATAATTPRIPSASFDPLPGITRVTPSQLREGAHRTLHKIYGGLPSGRLIIAGAPGTGKSSAAILLLLDALRYREQTPPDQRAQIPVPVLFTLQNWNPATTSVEDWITLKLTEIPLLRDRKHTAHLLRAGRIAVFLDGLDEIPQPVRPLALQALSEQATFRLVLLTRTTELAEAAQYHTLTSAAALELQPLTPTDAATYLLHPLTAPAPWQTLTNHLIRHPNSPLARALTTPLTITLLRDNYPPTPTANSPIGSVNELLDTSRFQSPR